MKIYKMENFSSIEIKNLGVNLEKISDFLYHEGPLLSLYRDKDHIDKYSFYKWVECDNIYNRWMVFSFSRAHLRSFLFKEYTLKQLISSNSFVFFIDINDNMESIHFRLSSISEIPLSYWPSENSFYKEGKYTEAAELMKNSISEDSLTEMVKSLVREVETLKKVQKEGNLIIKSLESNLKPKNKLYQIEKRSEKSVASETLPLYKSAAVFKRKKPK
jgi:hypothetical protein